MCEGRNTESNLKITLGKAQKINAMFESKWNSSEFELCSQEEHTRLHKALKAEKYKGDNTNIELFFDIWSCPYFPGNNRPFDGRT